MFILSNRSKIPLIRIFLIFYSYSLRYQLYCSKFSGNNSQSNFITLNNLKLYKLMQFSLYYPFLPFHKKLQDHSQVCKITSSSCNLQLLDIHKLRVFQQMNHRRYFWYSSLGLKNVKVDMLQNRYYHQLYLWVEHICHHDQQSSSCC